MIYTKTGDAGETALVDGTRVSKDDLRVEVYGTIDEANSWIGFAAAMLPADLLGESLVFVQSHLLGGAPQSADVERIEREIDAIETRLRALRGFVLPGGTPGAAALHLARTVVRRAERRAVQLRERDGVAAVNPMLLCFLNRVSDYLFVAARLVNQVHGHAERMWTAPA